MPDIKIFANSIDQSAMEQIEKLTSISAFSESKIRIMPDVHAGMGCVIGFTADLGVKVIPNIVGVDIGCGMYTVNIGRQAINFDKLDSVIREKVPSGKEVNEAQLMDFPEFRNLRCIKELKAHNRLLQSIGSLGSGNHFIEVDEAPDGTRYLVIHSGSRNLGKQVADLYQQQAIALHAGTSDPVQQCNKLITQLKEKGNHSEIQGALQQLKRDIATRKPSLPPELCYLEGSFREDYLNDMKICQQFAALNREVMAKILIESMDFSVADAFHTIHNYIDHDANIIRKGAISAKRGERLLIPINMRDGAILGTGKGNDDWNQSAPHGAGRLMSRKDAKRKLQLSEFLLTMNSVYTTSVSQETLDEAPMAYKSIDAILDHIDATVEVQEILKPVYNFKASS